MKKLQITLIALFLVVAIAFGTMYFHDRLTADHVAPVIVSDGTVLTVSVNATDRELCAGLTATDNCDGDLTDRIIVRRVSNLTGSNSAAVSYAVFDSSSNFCTFTREIYYTDYCKPHFSLKEPLLYGVSSTISLSDRLTASDVIDGDISQRIRIASSSLSNSESGEYSVRVQVTNSSGDTAIADLIVQVQNTTSLYPVIELSEYLIYVDVGSNVTENDLRGYLTAARESSSGASVSLSAIEIDGEVDTALAGSNHIRYSYTNDRDLTYTVILTVIVE